MFRDPIQAINAPPPRYLLESDSSDEEGQGLYPSEYTNAGPSSSHKSKLVSSTKIELKVLDALDTDLEAVLGIGQAGKYLLKLRGGEKILSEKPSLEIWQNGLIVGRGYLGVEGRKTLLISLVESELSSEGIYEVVEKLLKTISAKSWTVVSTYLPSIYVRSTSRKSLGREDKEEPIRYMPVSSNPALKEDSNKAGLEVYDSPNYATGIAGAFASAAIHPLTSFNPETSANIVLFLPLPLSSIPRSTVNLALLTTSPGLAAEIAGHGGKAWLETDDEPFVAPGMGRVRRAVGAGFKKGTGGDLESMYM